jgi:SsrA-binding protein
VSKVTQSQKVLAKNRRAFYDYEFLETYEAGIVLKGTEVRSLREGGGQLTDTFALARKGEVWLFGLYIRPFSHGNRANQIPDRPRKLLLHRRQIDQLAAKVTQAGLTLVPIKLYFAKNNLVKVELGLARGKKRHDKRAALAKKDSQREVERALKARG